LPRVYNVGWLSVSHDYARGSVARDELRGLIDLAARIRTNQMRGYHDCDLCEPREDPTQLEGSWLGSAELWVRNRAGDIYAAPDLILHYVKDHAYAPPPEFWDAVRWTAKYLDDWHPDTAHGLLVSRLYSS
jgi:hypothetical protein